MDPLKVEGSKEVVASTRAFIDALKATSSFRHFTEAKGRFDSDQEVQSLLRTLQEFQRAQRTGEVLTTGLEGVRDAQRRFAKHPVVTEFAVARDALGSLLQETNVEISRVLGVNFGQTAGRAKGGY